jgi:hypothetical protein
VAGGLLLVLGLDRGLQEGEVALARAVLLRLRGGRLRLGIELAELLVTPSVERAAVFVQLGDSKSAVDVQQLDLRRAGARERAVRASRG